MKKKSFGLAAAVAVLIVLGGSYALLANHNRIQESGISCCGIGNRCSSSNDRL